MKNILKIYLQELKKSYERDKEVKIGFTLENIVNTAQKLGRMLNVVELVELTQLIKNLEKDGIIGLTEVNTKRLFVVKNWSKLDDY